MAKGDEPSVRYACLELRLTIEYITYDQLLAYLKEVPNDALKKWQPRHVISEMREVDPHADQSVSLAVGIEHTYGVPPPGEEMQMLGQDRRFSRKWANDNHNALGNFLHALTIHQIESGKTSNLAGMIKRAAAVADECEAILTSPIFRVNFGQFFEFQCQDCGEQIQRRAGSFTAEGGVKCPITNCQAVYDVEPGKGNEIIVHLRQVKYPCPSCDAENFVGKHRVLNGATAGCAKCGKTVRFKQGFSVEQV
ncbi:MAG: hypothetical protein A3G34_10715 [Candidatus Lindowbacteria bacterium RIFCSPLOWO2_12_FULL_62_27]|nr:MAG: hypothetical protein A3G34_10715 [Candidatus Lindowbacteria bacterium RIFCSPLOWO2_12_FULL_62_27]